MAKKYHISMAANFFTDPGNNTRRVTEVVFDASGTIVAVHDKIHIAPFVEKRIGIKPGFVNSTSFDLLGRRWGILICYEGVYPYTLGHGDFSEMQGLIDQGVTAFVWSIGGMVPPGYFGKKLATRFKVPVVASEDNSPFSHSGAIISSNGTNLIASNTALPLALTSIGYTANASIIFADIAAPASDHRVDGHVEIHV